MSLLPFRIKYVSLLEHKIELIFHKTIQIGGIKRLCLEAEASYYKHLPACQPEAPILNLLVGPVSEKWVLTY